MAFIGYIIHVLGHPNPKLWVSEIAIVLGLCKLIEPRKKQLKVETLNDFKEFKK